MRTWTVLALGAVIAVGIVATGALVLERVEPTPVARQFSDLPAPPSTLGISVATTAIVPIEAQDPPPNVPPAVPDAPPGDNLAELPVQEVDPLVVHTVPDAAAAPVPHVTIQDREGHALGRVSASAPPPPSYVPSVGPAPNYAASNAPPPSYRPSVGPALSSVAPSPPPASYRPAVPPSAVAAKPMEEAAARPPAPSSLSGPAHATGTVSLAVNGQSVRLYGVLPPASTDRCALGTGAPQTCAEVTQAMLAARLARSASVTCQLPPRASATDPARICLDATGVDVAGYLVGEGLAVADPHAGNGYAGAESAARSSGKGLWRFR